MGAALKPRPARVWWLAARPATLAASVSPVLAGTDVTGSIPREVALLSQMGLEPTDAGKTRPGK